MRNDRRQRNKKKANEEISKILFSEKFYKFDSEDTIVENKENDQELIDILVRQHGGGSIGNRTYITAEIEKILTELDN
ncbi:unnamed protein product [Parnassius apollo]|uniref:(apollo) hypothetical protein n=1 Tax=Parnassius apollo TaxID=110799 RepID=A0A8S3XKB3_PARAO|nr:unnamed protein product [Parnassius apollo]